MKERKSHFPPEMGLWKSPDVVSTRDVLMSQGGLANIPVSITTDNLLLDLLSQRILDVNISARSRIAQLGLDLDPHRQIKHILANSIASNDGRPTDKPFDVEVEVVNRSSRPIKIPEGTGLFRLFSERNKPRLEGHGLVKMVRSGRIEIEGGEGEGWEWEYSKDGETPVGLFVCINRENRRWIPPHPEDEPIIIQDNTEDRGGRLSLDVLLEDIPQSRSPGRILWVGETVNVTLNGADLILDRFAFADCHGSSLEPKGEQINSRLVDDLRTNWGIRVEILSSTVQEDIPHWVKAHFVES